MALSKEEVQELARILDARAGHGRSERPRLRLVVPPTSKLLDPIFRDAHIKRIVHLQRAYRLQWLVDQATFNVASLSCLEDCDLIRLVNDMERARECIMDGVSFEDAGLVRSALRGAGSSSIEDLRDCKMADEVRMRVDALLRSAPKPFERAHDEAPF